MIPLGLNAAQLAALNATLLGHHQIRVRVQILDLDGGYICDVTGRLLDGQVNVDQAAIITRSLTMKLSDPDRALTFDSDSPSDAALFVDRMMRVDYGVAGPPLAALGLGWVDVPVFTGPISKLDRQGDVVNLEAQGKETLATGACWAPITWRKGTRKTTVIHDLLYHRAGETVFDIPSLPGTLPANLSLARESIPWTVAQQTATGLGRQLFYDGAGVCRLRAYPAIPLFTFTPPAFTSPLQLSYTAGAYNTVWVIGGTPKGAKSPITYTAVAPATHPMSPQRLGRNGVARYLMQKLNDDTLGTTAAAKKAGDTALAAALLEAVDATFDALPIPHLDPGDVVAAATDEGAVTVRLRRYSLPLTVGQPMTVGYLRNVSPTNRRPHRQ